MQFTVTYTIEVDAESHKKAALIVEEYMKKPCHRPVLTVTDMDSAEVKEVDLDIL